ncbi:MAG: hypothetical protein E7585_08905 [Ruminococcaceae bacterium]|nr:hypothetical protein [Oscillospiraceae bacterium]
MTESKAKITGKEKNEAFFYSEIYKSAKMGADAVLNLLPHIKEDGLRSVVTMQLDSYEKYAARAATALADLGLEAKEENIVTRMTAKMGVALHTMLDSGTSHVAEMMIEASNMCITDMTKLLNDRELCDSAPGAMRLAREMVALEESNLEMLKRYL